jgi:hypothetical protein
MTWENLHERETQNGMILCRFHYAKDITSILRARPGKSLRDRLIQFILLRGRIAGARKVAAMEGQTNWN